MSVLDLITGNLGMNLEDIILFGIVMSSLVFGIKDIRLSLVAAIIMFAGAFMLFYEQSMNYTKALIAMFVTVVLLALSILISYSKSQRWLI